MTKETFDYVVARHWDDGSKCIYTYHSQIQKGTMADAEYFLNYVKSRSPEHEQDYKIYRIIYEEVE